MGSIFVSRTLGRGEWGSAEIASWPGNRHLADLKLEGDHSGLRRVFTDFNPFQTKTAPRCLLGGGKFFDRNPRAAHRPNRVDPI
jgi:hypothetical protein